ncbi:hypothetical protein SAMN02910456_01226 [Ruminococcaceae bacterium YRB3002]|nr:hypothetical protein SAMN02910456_01226 [Ruminococcaceae bacterium YRB3002]
MTSVKNMTKTTVSMIVFAIGIALLMLLWENHPGSVLRELLYLFTIKEQFGVFHNIMISFSFWILMAASGVDAVLRDKKGLSLFDPFAVPVSYLLSVAFLILVAFSSTKMSIAIVFWMIYYVSVFICIRIEYSRICHIKGAGPVWFKQFIKTLPSQNDPSVSIIDRWIIYVTRIILLIDGYALLIAVVALGIQYWDHVKTLW